LKSGDVNDFNLSIGDTVGFCITYVRDGVTTDSMQYGPACRLLDNEQNLYGNILLVPFSVSWHGLMAVDAGEAIVEAGTETGELIIEAGKEAGKVIVDAGGNVVEKGVIVGEVVTEKTTEGIEEIQEKGGGCLIATATYGSEFTLQVQQLRELRDNKLLQTESGSAFMKSFNEFYYSFSPEIADFERENPIFREAVKIAITPMISSLSILNYIDMDSEAEVLGYGISLILLNVGMYFAAPVIVIVGIKKKF